MGSLLGEVLLELKFVTPEDLASALVEQRASGKRLGQILVDTHVLTKERLLRGLSRQFELPIWDPITMPVNRHTVARFPRQLILAYSVYPVGLTRSTAGRDLFHVATADPTVGEMTAAVTAELSKHSADVTWMIALPSDISSAIQAMLRSPPTKPLDAARDRRVQRATSEDAPDQAEVIIEAAIRGLEGEMKTLLRTADDVDLYAAFGLAPRSSAARLTERFEQLDAAMADAAEDDDPDRAERASAARRFLGKVYTVMRDPNCRAIHDRLHGYAPAPD